MVDSLLKTVTVKRPATVAEFEAVLGELQELAIADRVGLVSGPVPVSFMCMCGYWQRVCVRRVLMLLYTSRIGTPAEGYV